MAARLNIPSHGQSTKDFLPDVICGWFVLQRTGLSESSKKMVLGSAARWADRESWKLLKNSGQIMSLWHTTEIAKEIVIGSCETSGSLRRGESATDSVWNMGS